MVKSALRRRPLPIGRQEPRDVQQGALATVTALQVTLFPERKGELPGTSHFQLVRRCMHLPAGTVQSQPRLNLRQGFKRRCCMSGRSSSRVQRCSRSGRRGNSSNVLARSTV